MAGGEVTIYGPDGRPVDLEAARRPRGMLAYQAAARDSQEMANWHPFNASPDAAYLPERERLAGRIHDIVRNDGWASAGLQKHLDNVIGGGLRLSAKPDYRALGQDPEWAAAWAREVEAEWRLWTEDPRFLCDAARQSAMAGVLGRAYRHRIIDGEALAVLPWRPGRGGRYATTVQVVDPDRLENPNQRADSEALRGGVELGPDGEAVAYHLRRSHPGDVIGLGTARASQWTRLPRETPWGRPVVVHDFEPQRAGQTRGVSPFAPIVKKLRMLRRYDEVELQAALVNAVFAAFVVSPFDPEMAAQALDTASLDSYQSARQAFHEESGKRMKLLGSRIPVLYPGEDIRLTSGNHPNTAYQDFEETALRYIASASGLTYEQLSMDWSKTNYSSARAALVEVWRFFAARRRFFTAQFVGQVYVAWLEEAIDRGRVVLPPGAPDFYAAPAAYARAKWIGPPRGYVDPVKEAQGAQLRMEMGLSTLEDEAAEQGHDWEEVLTQRRRELQRFEELGLTPPRWAEMAALQGTSESEPAAAGGER